MEVDAIFTISVVKCNRRLHRSKQFGLKRHGTEAKERRKARVVPLLKQKFESFRILPKNKENSERR